MKAWLKEFGRSVLQKVIILGSIALGVTVIIFLFTRPAISESILDTVTLEDGHFSVDGLYAGMTRDEVAAYLDARKLVYFDGQTIVYPEDTPKSEFFRNALGTSWISLSDETRVTELGNVTVRRTYYFRDGALTHVDLETDVAKGKIADDVKRTEKLVAALENRFGEAVGDRLDGFEDTTGERILSWFGEGDSELAVLARLYEVQDTVLAYRPKTIDNPTFTDYYKVVVRVML
ncbi:MAG: hypothetical protein PUA86_10255 [Clostridiaceae bacterium]|nr:hypothetical protein [Clostridiaceae bacterium]